ncbi:phage shock protein C (PspC) family protein [Nocardia ignorata]|uniref:Phage shock protein C (PspC) family protein n=1 Tax=Nocardia ignorata TaxID=145285 RepID=A0A4R6PPN3_NOCIG|nr:phage shock protein C (PspC) family protein [Nocardia ignorata]
MSAAARACQYRSMDPSVPTRTAAQGLPGPGFAPGINGSARMPGPVAPRPSGRRYREAVRQYRRAAQQVGAGPEYGGAQQYGVAQQYRPGVQYLPTPPPYRPAVGYSPVPPQGYGVPRGYLPGVLPVPASEPGDPASPTTPRLVRRTGGRVIGGVAGGLADHLGVDVFKVRLAFVLLSALVGAGLVAYGLLWIFTPAGGDATAPTGDERRQAIGLALLGMVLAVTVGWLFQGTAAKVIVPVVVVAVGAALVWREYDVAAPGPRALFGLPARPSVVTWSRIVAGATLIVFGLGVVVLARIDLSSLGSALIAVAVTLVGAGLLTVPLWLRMVRALNAERGARIRNEEREEIASHLHDSVLQTLALIQRQAEDPQEVLRLARSQERELRKWLFDDAAPAHSSLSAALRTIAGEVEDQHGVKVTPVTVGDVAMDPGDTGAGLPKEHFTALLGATREALVNAAKHADVPEIDLFAETEPHQVSIFVRDRGAGFDVSSVPADRRGIAKSICARVERRGGTAEIDSTVGRGTEVRIVMPRTDSGTSEPSEAEQPTDADSPTVALRLDQAHRDHPVDR